MMPSFRESIEALKEAGLSDSEILDIMSDSVSQQMNGFRSIPKTISNNSYNKSGHEIPKEDRNSNAEVFAVRKRKGCAFSSEKSLKLQKGVETTKRRLSRCVIFIGLFNKSHSQF